MDKHNIPISRYLLRLLSSSHVYLNQKAKKTAKLVVVQENCKIEPYVGIHSGNVLCSMGSFSYSNGQLDVNFNIGRYCSIASNVQVHAGNHPYDRVTTSSVTYDPNLQWINDAIEDLGNDKEHEFIKGNGDWRSANPMINIGHDVWIGKDVLLKRGINIGTGACIAQRSIVTHDVPPYSIWGGGACKAY